MKFGFRAVLSMLILAASVVVPVSSASANGCGVSTGGPFDGGDGSSGSPFLVSTAAQLASMDVNACLTNSYHFKQTADISLDGVSWTPIGTAFEFDGSYDGDFKTISDLSMTGGTNVGLFGTITGATIKNLRLVDVSVSGSGYAGAVAAYTKAGSTLDKLAIVNANVTSTGNNAGGVTAMTQGARSYITNVSVDASVSAAANGGGLVGQTEDASATISDVSFRGAVDASGSYSGGIVGYGITEDIENAYSIGTVTGDVSHRGGILGGAGNGSGSVTNSYFLGSGVTQLSSNYATSKTASELATLSTYASATWTMTDDLDAVLAGTATEDWLLFTTVNGGYPVLTWQIEAAFVNPKIFATNSFFRASTNQVVEAIATTATYAGRSADYLDWVLTDDATGRGGAVWYKNRLDLTKDFEMNAEIYLGDSNAGADGLAFVLQSSAATSLSTGGGLGFGNIVPAFAVEFDTYPNGATTDHADSTNDYWGIYNNPSEVGGSASTDQAVDPDNVAGTDKQFSLGDIEDGNWRAVRFTWNALSETFAAYVDKNYDGDFADSGEVISKSGLALTGDSSTFGDSPVYWGFTASTGGATNEQRVRFPQGAELLSTGVANAAPQIENETDRTFSLAGGSQNVDFTISDDLTTQAQWSVSASSSDTGKATVSVAITSATNARLAVAPVAVGSSTVTVTITDADGVSATDTFVVSIASVPDAPSSVIGTAASLGAELSWTAPANTAGTAITGYKIEVSEGADYSVVIADTGTTATSYSVTGLTARSSYTFRVTALNVIGASNASVASDSVVALDAPAAPPFTGPVITNLALQTVSSAGGPLSISGLRLELVTSISIEGVELEIIDRSASSITLKLPELTSGSKDLRIVWGSAIVTHQDALMVSDSTQAPAGQKVNAGSFKGYVALYAKGHEGSRLSAKVGNDWIIVPSIPAATNDLYRLVDFTGAGVDVAVRIYIDRVLVDTVNLVTR